MLILDQQVDSLYLLAFVLLYNMRYVKTPDQLTDAPFFHVPLKFKNFTVMESCVHIRNSKGAMFLDEHMIYYVHKGKNIFGHGKMTYELNAGEMVVLPKSIMVTYDKYGSKDEDNLYQGLMIFLKDEFIAEFIKIASIKSVYTNEQVKITVKPVKERLLKFFESLFPYFNEPENIEEGLIRLKMLELLYDLTNIDKSFLLQLLQLRKQPVHDLSYVLENNYMNPVSLEDLAYLSGRSLSSFKREFQLIYNTTPAQWIREKRLNKAKELLSNTAMSVTDACYATGFENLTHFSRLFKEYFGIPPSHLKLI